MPRRIRFSGFASWKTTLTLACLFIVTETIVSGEFISNSSFRTIVIVRLIHLFLALVIAIYILFFRKSWDSRIAITTTVLLYTPTFILLYLQYFSPSLDYISSAPFNFLKVHFMIFPFLRLGKYRANLALILFTFLEGIYVWNFSSISEHFSMQRLGEPYLTLSFFVVSLLLLLSRYQDDQQVAKLTSECTRLGLNQKASSFMVTLQDRTNTPLQTMLLTLNTFAKDNGEKTQSILIMERNLQEVIDTHKLISQVHLKVNLPVVPVLNEEQFIQAMKDILGEDFSGR